MTNDALKIDEEVVTFDPELRRSWRDGGSWPHANLYHFYEAAVAAHFILRGYQVVRDYVATRGSATNPVTDAGTRLFHRIVGPEVSEFFLTRMQEIAPNGVGQPDLFVFREEHPNDPGFHFDDSRLWFFVEVKGPGDEVRDNQLRFWREVASRPDLGLNHERIRLFRVVPKEDTSG